MRWPRVLRAGSLSLLLVAAGGCAHHYFKVDGSLASDGGELGTWRSRPLGCSRDPVPPPAEGVYEDVATLLWDDGLSRDNWRLAHSPGVGNRPGRLELWRRTDGPDAGKIYGRMEMQKPVSSIDLGPFNCGLLRHARQAADRRRPADAQGNPGDGLPGRREPGARRSGVFRVRVLGTRGSGLRDGVSGGTSVPPG